MRSVYDYPCLECGGRVTSTARMLGDDAPSGCEVGHTFTRGQAFAAATAKFYRELRAELGQGPVQVKASNRLRDLYDELGTLRWMGADEGWDLAVDAVRSRINEMQVNAAARLSAYDNTWIKKMEQRREYKPPKWEGQQKPTELDDSIFNMAPSALAQNLRRVYKDDYDGAMGALTMYKNRAGKNLLSPDKDRIEQAKDQLRKLYHKEEHEDNGAKPDHGSKPADQPAPSNGKPIGSVPTTRTV